MSECINRTRLTWGDGRFRKSIPGEAQGYSGRNSSQVMRTPQADKNAGGSARGVYCYTFNIIAILIITGKDSQLSSQLIDTGPKNRAGGGRS